MGKKKGGSSQPAVDYQKLWGNYSRWQAEDKAWHTKTLSSTKARLAAAGQKEGSTAWKQQLAAVDSQYAEKVKTNEGTATYQTLKNNPGLTQTSQVFQPNAGWSQQTISNPFMGGAQQYWVNSAKTPMFGGSQRAPVSVDGGGSGMVGGMGIFGHNPAGRYVTQTTTRGMTDYYTKKYGGAAAESAAQTGPVSKTNKGNNERQAAAARERPELIGASDWLNSGAMLDDNENQWLEN